METFDAGMAAARQRGQWHGMSSPQIAAIATAHDEIAASGRAQGRMDTEASHMRWAASARLELALRGDLPCGDAFAWAARCDDAMQAALVRRFGTRAVEARYSYDTHGTPHDDVRWAMQAKLLADMGMAASVPWRRAEAGRAA